MGGENAGVFASRMAINITSSYLMSYITVLVAVGQNNKAIFEAVTHIIREANLQIIQQSKHDLELKGAGSTIDIALLIENVAYIAHVGSSRVYLVTKNDFQQLTEDHNILANLIRVGHMTVEQSKYMVGSGRHPYRLLGMPMPMDLEVDTETRVLDSESVLLLCSDGLLIKSYEEGRLDKPILEIIRNTPDLQLACEQLIDYANANGGLDNTSVILVKVVD